MKPFFTPDPNQVLPLEKLVKISRGKVYVPVDVDLLPRIDLSTLKRTLQFNVIHHFEAHVSFCLHSPGNVGYMQMSVSQNSSDWLEPMGFFMEMYTASLAIAANLTAQQDKQYQCLNWSVVTRHSYMLAAYTVRMPMSGNELINFIRRKLDAIHAELPRVNEKFLRGPVPGTTPDMEEDDAEALG